MAIRSTNSAYPSQAWPLAWARAAAADAVIALALLLAGLKLTWGIERIIDIGLYDESGYLYAGLKLAEKGLFPASWSPLYQVWYHLLSLFEGDPLRLYYLNYRILTIAPAIAIFLLMRSFKLPLIVSAAVGWMFLISVANLYVWPKPAHFALLIVLISLLTLRGSPHMIKAAPLLAIGALVGAYARPELLLSFLLFVLLYAALIVRAGRGAVRAQLVPALSVLASTLALAAIFGVPGLDNQGSRSYEAFAQHFSINWVGWTGSDLNPWTDYHQIMAQNFGDAASVGAAARYAPALFARHLLTNALNYAGTTVSMPFVHFNVLLPGSSRWLTYAEAAIVALLMAYLAVRRGVSPAGWRARARAQRATIVACAAFVLPAAVSAIVIYPEQHYLLAQVVLTAIVVVLLANDPARTPQAWPARRLLLVAAGIVALTPYLSTNWYFAEQSVPQDRLLNNLHTIEYIRSLSIQQEVRMLEADGGYYIYLGDHVQRVPQYDKATGFLEFLHTKNVDMIVVSAELRNDSRFRDDPEWARFLREPGAFGYTATSIPGTDRTLLMRASLPAAAR